jgi:TetR/AcrR family fatty acid metabolism transcriptional regulator
MASTMKTGQRREREIAHARNDILNAAVAAFAKKGRHNATMQDIAQEAGYTAASLYTYFKSKHEIVDAMLSRLTDDFVQVFEQPLPAGLSFRQRFEILLQRHLELAANQHNTYHSFFGAEHDTMMCGNDGNARAIRSHFDLRIQRLVQWLRDNAKGDELGGNNPEIVARLLVGMVFGLLHKWGQAGERSEKADTEEIMAAVPFLTEFFFHGISGKPKTGARKK